MHRAIAAPIALLLFSTRDIFTQRRHNMMSTVIGGFGVISGAIADRGQRPQTAKAPAKGRSQ